MASSKTSYSYDGYGSLQWDENIMQGSIKGL